MTRIYAIAAAAAIGLMGWQDYHGTSMFGRKADGSGWFSNGRRIAGGRTIGGYHTYNHK